MTRYSTRTALKNIGAKLKKERENRNWGIPHIQARTDLDYNTINKMEAGSDPKFSSFLEYCFALELHPQQVLNLEMDITPKIPPSNNDKTKKFRYTFGVKQLIVDGFFDSWRPTSEVQEALEEKYEATLVSNNLSSVLGAQVKKESLKVKKNGRRYFYMKNDNPENII